MNGLTTNGFITTGFNMRVLIACEYSATVRTEVEKYNHDVWSCDLLPTQKAGKHFQTDVRNVLNMGWDLMIAHPPCTYLSFAANHLLEDENRKIERQKAADFIFELWDSNIPQIVIENPRGWFQYLMDYDQLIQPYQYGEPYQKATCLWLKNVKPLTPTHILTDYEKRWARNKKGSHSSKSRSKTFQGIAAAMANQWANPDYKPPVKNFDF